MCAGTHTKWALRLTLVLDPPSNKETLAMNPTKLIGIILVAGGLLGLLYGGFSYTKETTGLKLGPIELKVQEKQRINIPLVVSAAGLAIGVFLLVTGRNK
jgi:hypothetical protein